jgi:hypothetical protein
LSLITAKKNPRSLAVKIMAWAGVGTSVVLGEAGGLSDVGHSRRMEEAQKKESGCTYRRPSPLEEMYSPTPFDFPQPITGTGNLLVRSPNNFSTDGCARKL